MIAKLREELNKKRRDNKGSAIVLVIIAIAFIGMLVAMILYMSYCNYLMKNSDRFSKNNFYSAEYALEVINAGIQRDISESMSYAYVDTLQDSSGLSADEMTHDFQEYYIKEIKKRLVVAGTEDKWDLDHLKKMWVDDGLSVTTTPGDEGAYLSTKSGFDINGKPIDNIFSISGNRDYMTLSGLHIVYTDDKGYVTIINTDLRVKVPNIDFAQSAMRMSVENFSIIANDALINGTVDGDTTTAPAGLAATKGSPVRISGNVFGGYKGVQVTDHYTTEFVIDPDDKTAGGVHSYNLITESLNVSNVLRNASNRFYVDDSYVTYVNDINLQTARLEMDGDVYVGDDMDIAGKGSVVRLKGKYQGYGNMYGEAAGSSSILINGAETVLDFSELKSLVLSGHAYVAARKYDADVDRLAYVTNQNVDDVDTDEIDEKADYSMLGEGTAFNENENTIPRNLDDIMMGESVSVKANQLLYLVPGDCIGFYASGVNAGKQAVTSNPMSYAEYQMLQEKEQAVDELNNPRYENGEPIMVDKYVPVRLSNLWNRLGGIAYTSKYQTVFRRVNGQVLVYFYLDFEGDEAMANKFFEAYYKYDSDGLEDYVKSYIADLQWNDSLNQSANLTLAGNAFRFDNGGKLQFLESSLENSEKNLDMISMQEHYSNIFEALMHTLSPEYEQMTSAQQNAEIFDSLVELGKLQEFRNYKFIDETGTIVAKITDQDVIYSKETAAPYTKLIITSGNVYVTADYDGLIIAGGNVYVCAGCSTIHYSPAEVLQALKSVAVDAAGNPVTDSSGNPRYAYDVFGESGRISYGVVEDNGAGKSIDLQDLITYENWKKE